MHRYSHAKEQPSNFLPLYLPLGPKWSSSWLPYVAPIRAKYRYLKNFSDAAVDQGKVGIHFIIEKNIGSADFLCSLSISSVSSDL